MRVLSHRGLLRRNKPRSAQKERQKVWLKAKLERLKIGQSNEVGGS